MSISYVSHLLAFPFDARVRKRFTTRGSSQVLEDEYCPMRIAHKRGSESLNFASSPIDALKACNQSFYSLDLISPVVSSLYGAPLFQSLCVV